MDVSDVRLRTTRGAPRGWLKGVLGALLVAMGCGGAASPSKVAVSAGEWSGTTAQGVPISFTITSDEVLTSLTIGYSFNGCTGTRAFSHLQISTVPSVVCVPGPCTGPISSYRQFAVTDGATPTGTSTSVNGSLGAAGVAFGQATFQEYPGCGTARNVQWNATRR